MNQEKTMKTGWQLKGARKKRLMTLSRKVSRLIDEAKRAEEEISSEYLHRIDGLENKRKAMEKSWEAMENAQNEKEWDEAEMRLEKSASNLERVLDLQTRKPHP